MSGPNSLKPGLYTRSADNTPKTSTLRSVATKGVRSTDVRSSIISDLHSANQSVFGSGPKALRNPNLLTMGPNYQSVRVELNQNRYVENNIYDDMPTGNYQKFSGMPSPSAGEIMMAATSTLGTLNSILGAKSAVGGGQGATSGKNLVETSPIKGVKTSADAAKLVKDSSASIDKLKKGIEKSNLKTQLANVTNEAELSKLVEKFKLDPKLSMNDIKDLNGAEITPENLETQSKAAAKCGEAAVKGITTLTSEITKCTSLIASYEAKLALAEKNGDSDLINEYKKQIADYTTRKEEASKGLETLNDLSTQCNKAAADLKASATELKELQETQTKAEEKIVELAEKEQEQLSKVNKEAQTLLTDLNGKLGTEKTKGKYDREDKRFDKEFAQLGNLKTQLSELRELVSLNKKDTESVALAQNLEKQIGELLTAKSDVKSETVAEKKPSDPPKTSETADPSQKEIADTDSDLPFKGGSNNEKRTLANVSFERKVDPQTKEVKCFVNGKECSEEEANKDYTKLLAEVRKEFPDFGKNNNV